MNKIIEILEDLKPGVDYKNIDNLIDGRYLDSLTILSLVSELEEEFDIEIPTIEIIPNNFNSIEKINELVEKLKEE